MEKRKISLFHPSNAHWREASKAVEKVLKTRWWGEGEKVKEFEKKFAHRFGFKNCVATNSGSAALELAYELVGITRGSEVITPVLTCSATNIPLARRKARILFADVNPRNLTVSYDSVKALASDSTRAMVVVTLGGIPVDDRIYALARERKIPVIVDACQSLGALQTKGDFVCYSFQAIKHFSTGDGGALVARRIRDERRARKLRWFGIDREKKRQNDWKCYKGREMTMDIDEPGWKFHMNDIAAVLGIEGLKRSDEYLRKRMAIAEIYDRNIKFMKVSGGSYWLYGILVPPEKRDEYMEQLADRGIETNLAHVRNDEFSVFGPRRKGLAGMDWAEGRYLYLPIHPRMSLEDARYVAREVNGLNAV